jgi:hypothetical protein
MLETVYILKEPLFYISKNTDNIEYKELINPKEFETLEYILKVFEVFIKPTTKLQAELYITSNTAILLIYKLINTLITLKIEFRSIIEKVDSISILVSYIILY